MKIPIIKLTERQKIFALSKVYGTDNRQDLLPHNGCDFSERNLAAKTAGRNQEGGSMKQALTDTLLAVAAILAFGALSYWLHWDYEDAPVNYQIQQRWMGDNTKGVRT